MWQWPDLKFCFLEWVAGILGTMTKKHTWDRQEKQRWMALRLDKGLILVLWYINIEIGWWFKLFIFTSWQVKKTKCLSPALFPTRITYFGKPRCPVPLAIGLQVAAGVRSFVYQAEQLDALWKTRQQPREWRWSCLSGKSLKGKNHHLTSPGLEHFIPTGDTTDLNFKMKH